VPTTHAQKLRIFAHRLLRKGTRGYENPEGQIGIRTMPWRGRFFILCGLCGCSASFAWRKAFTQRPPGLRKVAKNYSALDRASRGW